MVTPYGRGPSDQAPQAEATVIGCRNAALGDDASEKCPLSRFHALNNGVMFF